MRNDPAGRSTSSVGMGSGYDDGEVLHHRGFRGTEPCSIRWPFQVDGDQILTRVGPDVGDAVGELTRPLRSEERSDELLAAVAAELDAYRVDLEVDFRTCQRGNVIGEGRGRVARRDGNGHRAGHAVRPAERQRHIALPRVTGPGFRDGQRDPR